MAIAYEKSNLDAAVEWIMGTLNPGDSSTSLQPFAPGVPGWPQGFHPDPNDPIAMRDYLKSKVARIFAAGRTAPHTLEMVHRGVAVTFEPPEGFANDEVEGDGEVTVDAVFWMRFGRV